MNDTVQCAPTESQYRATNLAAGVIDLLIALICGLILVSLLLTLKKKAWESPVKRLTLALTISFALSSLTFALLDLSRPHPIGPCVLSIFLTSYWDTSILLYFNTLLVALLLQVSAAIIPEKWKHTQRYLPKAKYIDVILHLSVFILTVIISSVITATVKQNFNENLALVKILLLIPGALGVVFAIILFVFLFIKFRRTHVVKTTFQWAVLRLSVVLVIITFYILQLTLPAEVQRKLKYHNIVIVYVIFHSTMIGFVSLLLFLMVIYLPRTLCCKCHRRKDQLPLLPNTDMQHTTPQSEWDHSGVPSITVSVHPHEMSDCEGDNVSNPTAPGPKYGSTT